MHSVVGWVYWRCIVRNAETTAPRSKRLVYNKKKSPQIYRGLNDKPRCEAVALTLRLTAIEKLACSISLCADLCVRRFVLEETLCLKLCTHLCKSNFVLNTVRAKLRS